MICVDVTHRDWSSQSRHVLSAIEDPELVILFYFFKCNFNYRWGLGLLRLVLYGKAIAESSLGYFELGQIGFGMFLKNFGFVQVAQSTPYLDGSLGKMF